MWCLSRPLLWDRVGSLVEEVAVVCRPSRAVQHQHTNMQQKTDIPREETQHKNIICEGEVQEVQGDNVTNIPRLHLCLLFILPDWKLH